MAETAVGANLLEALEIVTELGVDAVGEDLGVLAVDDVALPVEEPGGDLVCGGSVLKLLLPVKRIRTLEGVLDDGDNALKLLRGEVTGALAQINIGLLADQVGVAATDTLDLGQGVHDLLLAIDVCVQQTDDVLEAVTTSQHGSMEFGIHARSFGSELDIAILSHPPLHTVRLLRRVFQLLNHSV